MSGRASPNDRSSVYPQQNDLVSSVNEWNEIRRTMSLDAWHRALELRPEDASRTPMRSVLSFVGFRWDASRGAYTVF